MQTFLTTAAAPTITAPLGGEERLLLLGEGAAGHVALAEVVLDGTLLGAGRLDEGGGATEGA